MADGYNVKLQEYCSYCKDFSPVLDQANITAFGDRIGKFSNSISCKMPKGANIERMMESLGMITQVGKNEHEDSADGLAQLVQLFENGSTKTTIINSPVSVLKQ